MLKAKILRNYLRLRLICDTQTIHQNQIIMLVKKLFSNRISLEYSKSEIALILISGIMLIMLNYFMISGIKHQHSLQNATEKMHVRK